MIKLLVWAYLFFISSIYAPFIVNLISNRVVNQDVFNNIVKITVYLFTPGTIIALILYWRLELYNKFIKSFQVVKSVSKLNPYDDFKIINYDSNSYINRLGNDYIKELKKDIEQGKNIKFIGMYQIGKTREAFEFIKQFEKYIFIKPKENLVDITNVKYPYFIKKHFIIFLDDIQKYSDTAIKNLKAYFKDKKCHFTIIATARTGTENEEFESHNETVEFKEVFLRTITEEEKNKLITDLGKNPYDVHIFNGTPGSITLDSADVLLIIKSKYIKFEEYRYIYKAIKLLKNGGLSYFKQEYIKKICEIKFQISDEKEWFTMLKYLKKNFLITYSDYYIDLPTYEYINYCVFDYSPSDDDFILLGNIVSETKNEQDICCLAYNCMRSRQFEKSKKYFEYALAINSKYAPAYKGLGNLFVEWGKNEKRKINKETFKYYLEEAIKYCQKSVEIIPNASNYRRLGNAFSVLGEDEKAEKAYRESLKLEQNSAFTHNLLGHLLVKKGDFQGAKDSYDRAIKIYPTYARSYCNLGEVFSKNKQFNLAIDEYRKALKYDPKYSNAYLELAIIYFKQKDYNNAKENICKAINYDQKNNGKCHYYYGLLLLKEENIEQAITELKIAIKFWPSYFEAYNKLSQLLIDMGNLNEGIKYLIEMTKINPEDSNIRCRLGFNFQLRHRLIEAEKEYRKAIELKNDFPAGHRLLAHLLKIKGKYNEAEKEFRFVVSLCPNDAIAHHDLGKILTLIKKFDEAEKEYKKALDLNPEEECIEDSLYAEESDDFVIAKNKKQYKKLNQRAQLYCEYGILLEQTSRLKEAKIMFEKAIETNSSRYIFHRHLYMVSNKLNDNMSVLKYEEAEKIFRENFFRNKNNKDMALKWVLAAERVRMPEEVVDIYRELFKIQPDNEKLMKIYLKFAEIYEIEIDENIYNVNSLTPNQNAFLGEYLRKLKKYELAMEYINKSLAVEQNNPYANENKGILIERLGDLAEEQYKSGFYIEAEKYYKRAIDNYEWHDSARRFYACLLYKKMGRTEEANIEFNKISQQNPNYTENERDYGIFLIETKRDIQKGINKIQKAIEVFRTKRDKNAEVEKLEKFIRQYQQLV